MKRCILSALLCCASLSQAIYWIDENNNTLSAEAIKALSLLNITLPEDLKDAHDILQKHYFFSLEDINKGVSVTTLDNQEVSHQNLIEFLEYADQHRESLTIQEDSLPTDTIAIVPVSQVRQVNEHIFALLKKHITSLAHVIIFAQDAKNKEEAELFFAETFPDYKAVTSIVATDIKGLIQSCITQLKESGDTWAKSDYIVVTHWGPWNDLIQHAALGDYKGSEYNPIPWRVRQQMYNDPNDKSQVLSQLRNLTVTVRQYVQRMQQ